MVHGLFCFNEGVRGIEINPKIKVCRNGQIRGIKPLLQPPIHDGERIQPPLIHTPPPEMIDTQSLKRAIAISEKIEALQAELNSLLGGGWSSGGKAPGKRGRPAKAMSFDVESTQPKKRKKRKMSPEALEKIRQAQKKRWAAFHKAQKAEAKA